MTDYVDLPLGGSPVAGDRDSNRPPNANVFPPRPPAHRPPHVQAAIQESQNIPIVGPEAASFSVDVSDPVKQGSGLQAFVTYKISCYRMHQYQKSLPALSVANRRYTHFVWLHTQLMELFPCYFIPALPEKSSMTSFIGSRFEEHFVESRRMALEQFLNRIVRHPDLMASKVVKTFLEGSDEEMRLPESKKPSFFSGLLKDAGLSSSSAKTGSFAPPDAEFDAVKTYVRDLEAQLLELHKFLDRMVRRRKELGASMVEFGLTLIAMGNHEQSSGDEGAAGTSKALLDLGSCCDHVAKSVSRQSDEEARRALAVIDDWLRLIGGVKEALKARSVAAETLLAMQSEAERRAKILALGGGQGKGAVTEGDVEEANRRAEEARARADALAARLRSEMGRFRRAKAEELRAVLCVLVQVQVKFGAELQQSWERVLPSLVAGVDPASIPI